PVVPAGAQEDPGLPLVGKWLFEVHAEPGLAASRPVVGDDVGRRPQAPRRRQGLAVAPHAPVVLIGEKADDRARGRGAELELEVVAARAGELTVVVIAV